VFWVVKAPIGLEGGFMRHEASSLSCHRLLGKVAYLVFEGFPAMAKQPTEQIAEATAEALTKSGDAAEKMMEGNAEALTESGTSSRAAIQELTKAYQELAAKNAKNLTAAMQSLAAVKSPTEFMELQQRLIKEGVQAAVSDSQHIAQLTTAVFTAAFEPVKRRIEAVQKTTQT
jgi:phasin family protein